MWWECLEIFGILGACSSSSSRRWEAAGGDVTIAADHTNAMKRRRQHWLKSRHRLAPTEHWLIFFLSRVTFQLLGKQPKCLTLSHCCPFQLNPPSFICKKKRSIFNSHNYSFFYFLVDFFILKNISPRSCFFYYLFLFFL